MIIGELRKMLSRFNRHPPSPYQPHQQISQCEATWQAAPTSLVSPIQNSPGSELCSQRSLAADWKNQAYPFDWGILSLQKGKVLSAPLAEPPETDPLARRLEIKDRFNTTISYANPQPASIRQDTTGDTTSHHAGRYALLGGFYADCNNYYHFWADVIADAWYLESMGVKLDELDGFILPYGQYRWQQQILTQCGLEQKRLLPFSSFSMASFDELVLSYRAKGGAESPSWLQTAIKAISGWQPPVSSPRKKIYLSRRDASRRRLNNEDTVIELLKAHHFEVHECSSLTIDEQQNLFAEAGTIIAPHGAALTNIIWCSPGTRLLELIPQNHLYPCFRDLCLMGQLEHDILLTSQDSKKHPGISADSTVPLEELKRWLER